MKEINSTTVLQDYRPAVEAALRDFMKRAPEIFSVELSRQGQVALAHLRDYCARPSKRVRGALGAAAYDVAVGSLANAQGAQLGALLELLQSYLLIIDDVMDKSPLRRGQPSLHRLYADEAEDMQNGEHVAEMLAINVGLLAQHLANLLLLEIDVPAARLQQAGQIMHANIAITGFGQIDDLYQQPSQEIDISVAEIIHKYVQKSSYYTFVNPLQLGFALGGQGDEATLAACERFGVPAGVAFQLHDDYLGTFGDQAGKSGLDDLREGKYTLLVAYALQHSPASQAHHLRRLLGKTDADESDLHIFRQLIIASGAEEYCRAQAADYAEQAKQQLQAAEFGDAGFRQLLSELVDYSIARRR